METALNRAAKTFEEKQTAVYSSEVAVEAWLQEQKTKTKTKKVHTSDVDMCKLAFNSKVADILSRANLDEQYHRSKSGPPQVLAYLISYLWRNPNLWRSSRVDTAPVDSANHLSIWSESLEEELADAHRLLSERSREAETMRRLLADAQGRADGRVREMQERLDIAIEERERAEEQEKELRRQKDDFERRAAQANEEAAEVRAALGQLRDALDDSEKQARDLDKLQKSSKTMSDELRGLKTRAAEANVQSSRSSLKSSRSRIASPTPKGGENLPGAIAPAGSVHLQATKGLAQLPKQRSDEGQVPESSNHKRQRAPTPSSDRKRPRYEALDLFENRYNLQLPNGLETLKPVMWEIPSSSQVVAVQRCAGQHAVALLTQAHNYDWIDANDSYTRYRISGEELNPLQEWVPEMSRRLSVGAEISHLTVAIPKVSSESVQSIGDSLLAFTIR